MEETLDVYIKLYIDEHKCTMEEALKEYIRVHVQAHQCSIADTYSIKDPVTQVLHKSCIVYDKIIIEMVQKAFSEAGINIDLEKEKSDIPKFVESLYASMSTDAVLLSLPTLALEEIPKIVDSVKNLNTTEDTWYQGFRGATGCKGVQGVQGPTEDTWYQGFRGVRGQPGVTGVTGPTGPTGLQGINVSTIMNRQQRSVTHPVVSTQNPTPNKPYTPYSPTYQRSRSNTAHMMPYLNYPTYPMTFSGYPYGY